MAGTRSQFYAAVSTVAPDVDAPLLRAYVHDFVQPWLGGDRFDPTRRERLLADAIRRIALAHPYLNLASDMPAAQFTRRTREIRDRLFKRTLAAATAERRCANCSTVFTYARGLGRRECVRHTGMQTGARTFACCEGSPGGCTRADHVHTGQTWPCYVALPALLLVDGGFVPRADALLTVEPVLAPLEGLVDADELAAAATAGARDAVYYVRL